MVQGFDSLELLLIFCISQGLFRFGGFQCLEQLHGQRFIVRRAKVGVQAHELVFLRVYMAEQRIDAGGK